MMSLVCTQSMAASEVSGPAGQWTFGGSISQFALDNDTAYEEGISDSAWALSVDANYSQSDWLTTISLDLLSYSDNEDFKQWVEGDGWSNDGDISTRSSDAVGIVTSFAFGKMWGLGQQNDLILSAQGGFSVMMSSERSIAYCDDCHSEDIDIDGGAFIRGGIVKNFDSVAVGLRATHYFSDNGLKNNIGVTVGMAF